MRPVQIPCRFFRQVIDSAYLCRTRIDDIKILCCLFIYIYDIFVILSEAEGPAVVLELCAAQPNACAEHAEGDFHFGFLVGLDPSRPARNDRAGSVAIGMGLLSLPLLLQPSLP